MTKRSRKLPSEKLNPADELKDILELESVRPNLAFLGLDENGNRTEPSRAPQPLRFEGSKSFPLDPPPPAGTPMQPSERVLLVPGSVPATGSAETIPLGQRLASDSVHEMDRKSASVNLSSPPRESLSVRVIPPTSSDSNIAEVAVFPSVVNSVVQRRNTRHIRPCVLAQDGHSHTEQEVYRILWENGVERGNTGSRLTQMGRSDLGKKARIAKRNITAILHRLILKQSIEIVETEIKETFTARVYRVYSYTEILKRRRTLGLEWVVRHGGVRFVNPRTGEPILDENVSLFVSPAARLLKTDETTSPGDRSSSGPSDEPSSGPGDISSTVADDATSSILSNSFRKVDLRKIKQETSSSNSCDFPLDLAEGLHKLLPFIDQEAIGMLWTHCRARCSDCSAEEILNFVKAKGSIALSGKIQNPIGFLLRAVPKCFEGDAFTSYRDEKRRHREEERKRQEHEQKRLKQLEEQGREEAEVYERDKQLIESLSPDDYEMLYEQSKQQILTQYPNSLKAAPKTVEDLVRQEMVRLLTDDTKQPITEREEISDRN